MSDQYNETVRTVQSLELRHAIDEMRAVRIEDGRNTIHEIQMRDEFGEWGTISVGVSRRRKGDRRDGALGGSLSLHRALANLAERHREAFAKRWPEYFPKAPKEVTDARAAIRQARAEVRAAQAQVAEALELLEKTVPFDLEQTNDQVTAAMRVLRGESDGKE